MLLAALALASALHAAPAPAAPAPASAPAADSLVGAWVLKGDVMGNPINADCTFKQTGATIGGTCAVQGGTTVEVAGEVKDGKTAFWHGSEYNGETLTLVYTIATFAPGKIEGTMLVKPFDAPGTFSLTPATPK